jgi:hypothetical protein
MEPEPPPDQAAAAADAVCLACRKAPIEYACVPCDHHTLCKVRGS